MVSRGELSGRCAIAGIGQTAYTRGTEQSTLELHLEASLAAIDDAGLTVNDIDAVMPHDLADRITEDFIIELGLSDIAFSTTLRSGGASYMSAVQSACLAVATGVANCVLLPAGRRGYSEQRLSTSALKPMPTMHNLDLYERPYGGSVVPVQMFSGAATRYMHKYGSTSEQLGRVAVTFRNHAQWNPRAVMYGRTMTMPDYEQSPMIATPFRLFDCSIETDGAAAVVVTSSERARNLKSPLVLIAGVGEGHSYPPTSLTEKEDMTWMDGLHRAGKRAYEMANMGPADIDCLEAHDGFTWFILAGLEALGFCGKGEAGPFVEDGALDMHGSLPTNTHGGSLSEAHVSGANHVVEAVRQLRRDVEPERQVDCETVLVASEGDFYDGSVLILTK